MHVPKFLLVICLSALIGGCGGAVPCHLPPFRSQILGSLRIG